MKNYLKTELSKLELSIWLHAIAHSLVAVFIPVILFQMGFALPQIILFLLLFNLMDVPLNLVARKMVLHLGAVKTIGMSIVAGICYFGMLGFASPSWQMLIVLAFFAAVYDSFYWVAHWFVFNECVRKEKEVGKHVGITMVMRSLGAFVAPGVGMLCLIFFGKSYLIVLSTSFFLVSLLPLFEIRNDRLKPKSEKSMLSFVGKKENHVSMVSTLLYAVHSESENIILPLLVFVAFANIGDVGIFPMVAALVSALFIFYIGNIVGRFNRIVLVGIGAICICAVWLLRLVIEPQLTLLYLTAITMGFFSAMVVIPIDARLAEAGRKSGMLNAATYRNVAYMGMNVVIYALLYLSLEVFQVPFAIAAGAMFVLALINGAILLASNKKKK